MNTRRAFASIALALASTATLGPHTALALSLVATNDTYSVRHDHTLNVPAPGVLGNDLNLLGSSTAVLDTTAAHGTLLLRSNGSFTYSPSAGYIGADTFRYHAHDVVLLLPVNSTIATVTINVTNAPPVANADRYTASTGVTKSVPAPGVLGNDTDADGDGLTAQLVDGGGNGSLNLNADGSFTFKSGGSFVGDRTFTYRAWDGFVWSGVATVTITVSGPAPTPTPTPTPTSPPGPTPTPAPTPTPPPGATPSPGPTPTARPGATASPSPMPTTAGVGPGTSPAPGATPGAAPSGPASSPPAATSSASVAPAGSSDPGSAGSAGPAGLSGPIGPAIGSGSGLGIDPIDPVDSIVGVDFVSVGSFEWAVPTLVLSVPGLLLILAIAAQGGAGILSIPFVRRWLGGFGLRRRRRALSGSD